MDNRTILKLLNNKEYEELKKLILQEIAIKDSKDTNTAKGILSLSKMVKKEMAKVRPALAGAFYNYNNTQICNGYLAYINDNKLEGLETAPDYAEPPDFNKVIQWNEGVEVEFDRQELSKAVADKKIFMMQDVGFNPIYVSKVAKCFNSESVKIKLINEAGQGRLLFIDEDSRAVVLSLRKGATHYV